MNTDREKGSYEQMIERKKKEIKEKRKKGKIERRKGWGREGGKEIIGKGERAFVQQVNCLLQASADFHCWIPQARQREHTHKACSLNSTHCCWDMLL